jgi:hypothetical protein
VNERRFFNPTQPQTLQIAVILLYIDAAFGLLQLGYYPPLIGLILIGTMAGGAYGIANEQRWGYFVGIFGAVFNLGWPLLFGGSIFGAGLFSLMFGVALVALLLHPMSRDYQRIWFK